jgi:hypothetical protein
MSTWYGTEKSHTKMKAEVMLELAETGHRRTLEPKSTLLISLTHSLIETERSTCAETKSWATTKKGIRIQATLPGCCAAGRIRVTLCQRREGCDRGNQNQPGAQWLVKQRLKSSTETRTEKVNRRHGLLASRNPDR